jgi:dienelactone hydrolase
MLSVLLTPGTVVVAAKAADTPVPLTDGERAALERDVETLHSKLAPLRDKADWFADAEIFAKGITWALRYEKTLQPGDVALIKKALARGKERVETLGAGKQPWTMKKGRLVRGYVSKVDASTQPFGLIVPSRYDPATPIRLDVVLHGSTRPTGLSELRFMNTFDDGDAGGKPAPDVDYIELHPLGRVENCYRWAGEADVFEAIEAVCRNYKIDRDRIVLRGMSMGASGTWHLGLKHPDRFVALGPYCGYVDTYNFSKTPLKNFVKVENLLPYQDKALHMLDSIDYAANAGVVPVVACMGEKDVFFQAHVLMAAAMEKEGLKLTNLISPGTGHVIDPVAHKEQMKCIAEYAAKGIDRQPRKLRFVTWTLKYPSCFWLEIVGLEEHYRRAEVEAEILDEGSIDLKQVKNISRLVLRPPVEPKKGAVVRVQGHEVGPLTSSTTLTHASGTWKIDAETKSSVKAPGRQGPIDDAFTSPFLCVRGTGTPWNPAVDSWANADLNRFRCEWHRYFRGELPVKNDRDVTEEDVQNKNLILFGDPGSNRWIAKALPNLPVEWTREKVCLAENSFAAGDHAPVFIAPNPLHPRRARYIVINSGHTFLE